MSPAAVLAVGACDERRGAQTLISNARETANADRPRRVEMAGEWPNAPAVHCGMNFAHVGRLHRRCVHSGHQRRRLEARGPARRRVLGWRAAAAGCDRCRGGRAHRRCGRLLGAAFKGTIGELGNGAGGLLRGLVNGLKSETRALANEARSSVAGAANRVAGDAADVGVEDAEQDAAGVRVSCPTNSFDLATPVLMADGRRASR